MGEAVSKTGSPPSTPPHSRQDGDRTKQTADRVGAPRHHAVGERALLRARIDAPLHPCSGCLRKEAAESSSFGVRAEQYACLHTSRVSNSLCYSPLQYVRSPRDLMPHELRVREYRCRDADAHESFRRLPPLRHSPPCSSSAFRSCVVAGVTHTQDSAAHNRRMRLRSPRAQRA